MNKNRLVLTGFLFSAFLVAGRPAAAGEFDPVAYELLPGSVIIDGCDCERPAIERPLEGSFVATRLPVKILGELYALSGIQFSTPPDDPSGERYLVKGSGSLHRLVNDPDPQTLTLEITVNGKQAVQLTSGQVEAGAAWPAMDLTAGEDGSRDPAHIYRIRLVAARSTTRVPYRLVEGDPATFQGSFFIDDCRICARPSFLIPIGGTFLLRQTGGGGPNPFTSYAVESLDLQTLNGPSDYRLLGGGTYEWGGEVALVQSMDLTVCVNDEEGVMLASDKQPFPAGVEFPVIDLQLEHQNPLSEVHVYSLKLVADPVKPEAAGSFRRGDANGDGGVDVSDPVFILFWQFNGSTAPGCLEAADADGNGSHEITDAVGILNYLFLSGPEPPDPGPASCGPAPAPVFGCEKYLSCSS